ncbi:MAG TPA: hypothetical protein VK970_10850, partial [Candidatus Methylacidiphilales bacterium]|nr:hypothetical protein [Candidatus Methylacidiphilales bacterium]
KVSATNKSGDMTMVLQYRDASNRWRPYNVVARERVFHTMSNQFTGTPRAQGGSTWPICYAVRVDPRTDRFSVGQYAQRMPMYTGSEFQPNNTMRPSQTLWNFLVNFYPRRNSVPAGGGAPTLFNYNPAINPAVTGARVYMGMMADNQLPPSGNHAYYTDPDGVTRPGDGFRKSTSTADGNPLFHTAPTSVTRPIILNRAFRSVAEIGYAYRDLPFKSIDLWSSASGDAALLDMFSVGDEPAVVAGRINLSNAPASVITALLSGAALNDRDTASNLGTEAPALANAIARTLCPTLGSGPLGNRADIVTRLGAPVNAAYPTAPARCNKAQSEAAVRALAGAANTRTWNLMIDVIAQSGRMSPTAAGLKDFVVEGQRRYWLHVAIDRFTGKIIDQQLEPVYE